MNNTKLYRHRQTNELYAIRRKGSGEIVGSAGPLDKNQIDDLEALPVTADNNAWIEENARDLILVSPLERYDEELSKIAGYIKDLDLALIDFDTKGFSAEAELPEIDRVSKRLMEMSAQSDDEDFRVLMAMFEEDARDCRECILRRLGKGN